MPRVHRRRRPLTKRLSDPMLYEKDQQALLFADALEATEHAEQDISPNQAKEALAAALQGKKGIFWTPCGAIEDFLKLLDNHKPGRRTIFMVRAANQIGKTTMGVNLMSYLAKKYPNPYFDASALARFQRPNRGRLYTTANAAQTTYADRIAEWFPHGEYYGAKRGRTFTSEYQFDNGSIMDVFTFDRDPMQGESVTLDWAVIDEPLPYKHWQPLISRFSHGGIIIILMTPLEGSAWMHTLLETDTRIGRDVFIAEIPMEAACQEHGIRGHLPHAYIEQLEAECDEDERDARIYGKYMHLSGAVYKRFDQKLHLAPALPEAHRQAYDSQRFNLTCLVDPHDRKPFTVGWYATFADSKSFCIAEFPDDTLQPYHRLKSSDLTVKDYAEIIAQTERAIGKQADFRIIDPFFGQQTNFASKRSVIEEFKHWGNEIGYPLTFVPAVNKDGGHDLVQGHLAVKDALGDPKRKIPPTLFFLEHCKNHIFGMKNYAYKQDKNKLLGEVPELLHKDFPDLVRYFVMAGIPAWTAPDRDSSHASRNKPISRPRGYRGL